MLNYTTKELLVIDDNDDDWNLIDMMLRTVAPDMRVRRANGPEQALTLLTTQYVYQLPQLILQDWYMPTPAEGRQLLQTLKDPASIYRSIPVVVFSNSPLTDDVHAAYQLGCSSYIVKSYDPQQWQSLFDVWGEYWWKTAATPNRRWIISWFCNSTVMIFLLNTLTANGAFRDFS